MEGQSKGSKKLNTLELQWTKPLNGMSKKCPFVPAEIKEHTTANKIGSGAQGTARESFEIQ